MRIALITSKVNMETAGGAAVDLHLKAKYLAEHGHDVLVVTARSEQNRLPSELPYRVAEEHLRSWSFIDVHQFICRILKKYESAADVFYIDGHLFVYGAGFYRRFGGAKPIVGFFNIKLAGWPEAPFVQNLSTLQKIKHYLRFALERTLGLIFANALDAFIFTTPSVAALYTRHGFDMRKSHILLDFAERTETVPMQKQTHGDVRFFASGRMIPEKGFDLLIRAFANISASARLTISGDGPEAINLKRLAAEVDPKGRIEFPGWVKRDELYRLMDASDVFILPRWIIEYSSVLLTEAMARGLPVIVPRGGGLEWTAGEGGISFTDGDETDLARAMKVFITDPALVGTYAQKARTRSELFSISRLGKELVSILSAARS